MNIPVAWGEMDAMGHINNIIYFRYFETVRIEYFNRLDYFS
jgi:acyl-CoA thioester hydrolase